MATNSLPGYHNVRSNMLAEGKDYSLWLHNDGPTVWHHCKLISKPDCSVALMKPEDSFVFQEYDSTGKLTERKFVMVRNKFHPYFLITYNVGVTGKKVQTRVTFVEKE